MGWSFERTDRSRFHAVIDIRPGSMTCELFFLEVWRICSSRRISSLELLLAPCDAASNSPACCNMREDDSWEALDSCAMVLKTLAVSLLPYAAAPLQPAFKIVPSSSVDGERVISCDPAEVVDAYGFDNVAVELLREAMDGLAAANFGRREQARLVLLTARLLSEATVLRRAGLSVWSLQSGLRQAADLAELAVRRLVVAPMVHVEELGMGELSPDDVSWFFAAEPLAAHVPQVADCGLEEVVRSSDAVPAAVAGDAKPAVGDICAELCQRHGGPVASQHCFAYGRQGLVQQPRMRLFRGIACHIPKSFVCCAGSLLTELIVERHDSAEHKVHLFGGSVCLDADLVSAAYDSCAPPQRRTKEHIFQNAGARLLSSTDEEHRLLSEAVHVLSSHGTEAILISGEVSSVVGEACRAAGLLLLGGIPARQLHALAADLGTEVLHGLPAVDSDKAPQVWQAKRKLQVELLECKPCPADFGFPLLGFRQPLLPHQNGAAQDLQDPFWEVWAAGEGGKPAASVVLLESGSEAQLRQLHAELHDTLLSELSQPCSYTIARDWMVKTAEALEETLSATSAPDAAVDEQDPLLAPWLQLQGDPTGDHAACQGLASTLRQVEAEESEYCSRCHPDEEETSLQAETSVAAITLLRRGIRFVEVILSFDEIQLREPTKGPCSHRIVRCCWASGMPPFSEDLGAIMDLGR